MARRLLAVASLVCLVSHGPADDGGAREFYFPSTGVRIEGQALLLAIDDLLLPLRENVVEHRSKPTVRPEPVLVPSKDDPRCEPKSGRTAFLAVWSISARRHLCAAAVESIE